MNFILSLLLLTFIGSEILATQIGVINLKENALVFSDIIKMSDIAIVQSSDDKWIKNIENIVLGDSPNLGNRRPLSRFDVLRALRRESMDTRKIDFLGHEHTWVTRPGIKNNQVNIINSLKKTVINSWGISDKTFDLKSKTALDYIFLPPDNVEFKFDIINGDIQSRFIKVDLRIFHKEIEIKKVSFNVEVVHFDFFLAANRNMNVGEKLFSQDLMIAKRNRRKSGNSWLTKNEDSLVGKVLKRNIREGQFISTRDVKKDIAIKKGSRVTLILKSGLMVLTAQGMAKSSGAIGDLIRVENESSKKEILGEVVSKFKVKVTL